MRSHTRRFASGVVVVALMLLSLASQGCSVLKQPTASLNAMNVTNVTPDGFTMNFDLNVTNPNAVSLPVGGTTYAVALGGVKVMEGKANPSVTLPANGSTPVSVPVTLTYDNLLAAEKAIASGGGKVPYAFTGSLDAGEIAGKEAGGMMSSLTGKSVSVPLKYSGTLDVTKMLQDPQILMKSPAAKKLAAQLAGSLFKL